MKLKEFINVLEDIYSLTLYDDTEGEVLFSCKTDSKALLNYEEWEVVGISLSHSLTGCAGLEISIKKGDADNE